MVASIVSRWATTAATSWRASSAAAGVAFGLGEVALEDRVGGPLAELRLEDRGEGAGAGRSGSAPDRSSRRPAG